MKTWGYYHYHYYYLLFKWETRKEKQSKHDGGVCLLESLTISLHLKTKGKPSGRHLPVSLV